jgi:hypothetical protein
MTKKGGQSCFVLRSGQLERGAAVFADASRSCTELGFVDSSGRGRTSLPGSRTDIHIIA